MMNFFISTGISSYYIGHPDIPEFKYDIGYFNQNGNQYIQVVFKTMTQLITIYKALADDFRSNDIQFYDNHIEIYKGKHQTILKPLSDQMVAIDKPIVQDVSKSTSSKMALKFF